MILSQLYYGTIAGIAMIGGSHRDQKDEDASLTTTIFYKNNIFPGHKSGTSNGLTHSKRDRT